MQGVRWAGWVTGFLMLVFGAFWMFMWLIGSNGFNSSRGAMVLWGNLLLVVLAVLGAVGLACRLSRRWLTGGRPAWQAVPLAIVSSFAAGFALLAVGCFAVLAVARV